MNILNILRKSYLAIFLASLVMFVSCSKYDSIISEEQKFDYSLFEEFKTGKHSNDFVFKFNSKNTKTENFKSVVNKANSNLNVNIDFPEEAYELIEYDADKIYTTS